MNVRSTPAIDPGLDVDVLQLLKTDSRLSVFSLSFNQLLINDEKGVAVCSIY